MSQNHSVDVYYNYYPTGNHPMHGLLMHADVDLLLLMQQIKWGAMHKVLRTMPWVVG